MTDPAATIQLHYTNHDRDSSDSDNSLNQDPNHIQPPTNNKQNNDTTTNNTNDNKSQQFMNVTHNNKSSDKQVSTTYNIITQANQRKCKLKFFRNQVAGHNALLWDSGTVCKPLIPAEYDFYSTLEYNSPKLIPYVPKYYGIMSIDKSAVSDDDIHVMAQNNASHNNNDNTNNKTNDDNSDTCLFNRWAYKCLQKRGKDVKKQLNNNNNNNYNNANNTVNMKSKSIDEPTHKQYIVLEDLTFAYSKPSILDLKLGTRQHGDNDSPAKIESKIARCKSTTSSSIGLRLCGMQVYRPIQHRNIYRDKYYGRSLDVTSFKLSLRDYFWDGQSYRTDAMIGFIQRLTEFRQALIDEPNYRFYSSSLLLVYEGADYCNSDSSNNNTSNNNTPDTSLSPQNITSNNTPTLNAATVNYSQPQPDNLQLQQHTATDNNVDLNNNNNITYKTSLQSSPLQYSISMPISLKQQQQQQNGNKMNNDHDVDMSSNGQHNTDGTINNNNSMATTFTTWPLSFLSDRPPPKIYARKRKTTHAQAKERARQRGGIDVRIIDFAHTVRLNNNNKNNDNIQQDSGLLLGFTNLINYIKELLEVAQKHELTNCNTNGVNNKLINRSTSDLLNHHNHQRNYSHHNLTTITENNKVVNNNNTNNYNGQASKLPVDIPSANNHAFVKRKSSITSTTSHNRQLWSTQPQQSLDDIDVHCTNDNTNSINSSQQHTHNDNIIQV